MQVKHRLVLFLSFLLFLGHTSFSFLSLHSAVTSHKLGAEWGGRDKTWAYHMQDKYPTI